MTPVRSFRFVAVRPDGRREQGWIQAPDQAAAAALIARDGSFPVEVRPGRGTLSRAASISAEEMAQGLRALAMLLDAAIPLARGLAILPDLAPPSWRLALPTLQKAVETGDPFGRALAESGLPLPPFVIGVIEAGELRGDLPGAVRTATEMLEQRAATRAALRNALAYPMVLAAAGGASVVLLVGVVLPRFAGLLADLDQALPTSTRIVLGAAGFLKAALLPGGLLLGAAVVFHQVWASTPAGRAKWHGWLLRLPLIGPIRRSHAAGSASGVLGSLLEAGVTLPAAIPQAAQAAGDLQVQGELMLALGRIGTGQAIGAALAAEGALTPALVRLVRIGEESAQLPAMLAHGARVESGHAIEQLQRLIRFAEPLMILVFGGLVMVVAAALMQAMYGLRPS